MQMFSIDSTGHLWQKNQRDWFLHLKQLQYIKMHCSHSESCGFCTAARLSHVPISLLLIVQMLFKLSFNTESNSHMNLRSSPLLSKWNTESESHSIETDISLNFQITHWILEKYSGQTETIFFSSVFFFCISTEIGLILT